MHHKNPWDFVPPNFLTFVPTWDKSKEVRGDKVYFKGKISALY